MKRIACLLLLSAACHEKHPSQGSAPSTPILPTSPTAVPCVVFALVPDIDRRVSHQTATIRGGVLIEVKGYGQKPAPAAFGPLPLDAWYEFRGTDARGCWSEWTPFYFSSNPTDPATPTTPAVPGAKPDPKPEPQCDNGGICR